MRNGFVVYLAHARLVSRFWLICRSHLGCNVWTEQKTVEKLGVSTAANMTGVLAALGAPNFAPFVFAMDKTGTFGTTGDYCWCLRMYQQHVLSLYRMNVCIIINAGLGLCGRAAPDAHG